MFLLKLDNPPPPQPFWWNHSSTPKIQITFFKTGGTPNITSWSMIQNDCYHLTFFVLFFFSVGFDCFVLLSCLFTVDLFQLWELLLVKMKKKFWIDWDIQAGVAKQIKKTISYRNDNRRVCELCTEEHLNTRSGINDTLILQSFLNIEKIRN